MLGASDAAVWGECQGSGSKPYQTQVDVSGAGPTFRCSCPSRKFPCKHGLALLLLQAQTPQTFTAAEPAWVSEWRASRQERAEKKEAKASEFCEQLRQALQRHPHLPPSNFELEVLETAALKDMEQAVALVARCKQLGVHFSLDDFGTGYSSLSYLRRLPVDELKIDQSFVRDMLTDDDDRGIVQAVIQLAHVFNRQVIAEGVETQAHGAALLSMGCHHAQGYGIARPMPAADFSAWMTRWHADVPWLAIAQTA
jgi:predicted signal transduction protein with EAL and GGDEF domain